MGYKSLIAALVVGVSTLAGAQDARTKDVVKKEKEEVHTKYNQIRHIGYASVMKKYCSEDAKFQPLAAKLKEAQKAFADFLIAECKKVEKAAEKAAELETLAATDMAKALDELKTLARHNKVHKIAAYTPLEKTFKKAHMALFNQGMKILKKSDAEDAKAFVSDWQVTAKKLSELQKEFRALSK